jgi:hypothetical protein
MDFITNLLTILVVAGLAIMAWGLMQGKKTQRTPQEVAGYLRNLLNEGGTPADWQSFIDKKIANPALEAIRVEAERIPIPMERSDETVVQELLKRAESL